MGRPLPPPAALYFLDTSGRPGADLILNMIVPGEDITGPNRVVIVRVGRRDQRPIDDNVADIRPAALAAANGGVALGQGRPVNVRMPIRVVVRARGVCVDRGRSKTAHAGAALPGREIPAGFVRPAGAYPGAAGNGEPLILNPPPPPLLLRKLKNYGYRLAGNARLPLRQPALLRRDKAAERAVFPPIDRVIPLVAVFAGLPSFRLAKGVRLVNAAVKGLAPVLRQGFQDGGSPVGVGKGSPVGTVPRNGTGVGLCCPPPPSKRIRLTRQ